MVSPVHVLDDESARETEVDDLERCARDDDGQSGLPRAGILLSEFCKSRAEHCLPVNYCARPLRPSGKMQQQRKKEVLVGQRVVEVGVALPRRGKGAETRRRGSEAAAGVLSDRECPQ